MNEAILSLQKNHLITPDAIELINQNPQLILEKIAALEKKPFILSKEVINLLITPEIEKEIRKQPTGKVIVTQNYLTKPIKREVKHFVSYFRIRYENLKKILETREELKKTISIKRIKNKESKEKVALIGLVAEKRVTKNGNILLKLEDPTDEVIVIVNKTKKDLFEQAQNLTGDEVIGITGSVSEKIIFVNNLFLPDIPLTKELKKSPDEAYAAFISDIHVGSKMFLPQDFERFINWLNGEVGNKEQKETSQKIKYLFIIGDLIDGVGIYPEQDKELTIKDVEQQYDECAKYLSKIRSDIQIIICGGNHDALRIAEPQPPLNKEYAKKIYALPNATLVSNPALVNIHSSTDFPGFDVLLYHGYSFDYYVANVDTIRNNGGYDRADLIMQMLLQKRHLAPTHSSTLYIPDQEKDSLTINKVPDFFVTGHIHKANVGSYRNVTTISSSCWQAKTAFQEKVGHNPEPSRVPIVNLKTRQIKVIKFANEQ
ncbi:DNA-directed DNA polymerase II small subunit [Candidatus Woesearchaeota archaeon]|nr:DNA-directed DNA polymerase II small subunit [Candidatus Woesearchaeota archaeon]